MSPSAIRIGHLSQKCAGEGQCRATLFTLPIFPILPFFDDGLGHLPRGILEPTPRTVTQIALYRFYGALRGKMDVCCFPAHRVEEAILRPLVCGKEASSMGEESGDSLRTSHLFSKCTKGSLARTA